MESGCMLHDDGGEVTEGVDDSAAFSRRGLLIETVAASIADVLNASSVTAVLPAVLAEVAKVVRIDRLVMVEVTTDGAGAHTSSLFYIWSAPDTAVPEQIAEQIKSCSGTPALADWLAPLAQGKPVVTVRRTANPVVRQYLTRLGVVTSLMVPIIVEGRHWGQIDLEDCTSGHDWAPDDIKIMTMVAEVIGAAITRDRFLAQAQQRERLLKAVNQSAAEIISSENLQDSVATSLRIVAGALGVDRVVVLESVRTASGIEQHLLRNFWHARDVPLLLPQIVASNLIAPDPDVVAWLAPLREGVAVTAKRSTALGGIRGVFDLFGINSVLLVPIMVDARYWGHITIDVCHTERDWNGAEVDALRTLADTIGTAITRERHLAEIAKANTIIQSSPTILYRLRGEPSLPMTYISQNIALLGYGPNELLAEPTLYREIIHPEDRAAVQNAMLQLLQKAAQPNAIEFRMLSRNGDVRWVENRYTPVRERDGTLVEIEGILTDITERKQSEERIALLARTDALTGVANRLIFNDRLRQAFAAAQRGASAFAVLYLDLDRFKEVNDTLGHHAGDRLLQHVARRLTGGTREIDVVARLGGDEFAIIQAEVTDSAAAGTLAEKLIEIVSAPYVIDGNELRIGASIGIALWDRDAPGPDALLAESDQALYRAKQAGRGQYRFHSEEIDHETREHLMLAEDLRAALARGELEIHYQPQVELVSGKIVGMEALLRWNHPGRGLLLPEDFLPIAEKFGIMQQLGRWALDGACRQMALWRQQQMSVPVIVINVALAQIKMGAEFVHDVMESLQRWSLKPSDLELDVTEQVLARTTLSQSDVLIELRRLGVGIAIDEFGAKYSSLDYLRTYNVSRLKIARGMVAAADGHPGGSSMIRAILSLAGELGLDVVAEGIENETQRNLLAAASTRLQGQGFYYSHAVTARQSTQMLRLGAVHPGKQTDSDTDNDT
jgi:diguanylate cyclase (GGDEF)-like protein/PAS domain S-box-containing protein